MRDSTNRRVNSHRYPGYDYSQPGMVFVTLCTEEKQRLFGDVHEGQMRLSAAGLAVNRRWHSIPARFPTIAVDAHIVMPDHLHGILCMGMQSADPEVSLGDVISWLKTAVLRDYASGVRTEGWPPYGRVLWQRDYYDRIIRNEGELETRRNYMASNPSRWQKATGVAS
jgi:REP element-mobilizing transposase RayT